MRGIEKPFAQPDNPHSIHQMNAPRCATGRDLARYLKVHQTTVSLALRNDPRIPAETRQRIQAAAVATGYRVDQRLSSMMRYVRQRKKSISSEAIAYVVHSSEEHMLNRASAFQLQHRGASEHALALGFSLNKFIVGPGHYSFARLRSVLEARGVHGVVIGPMPADLENSLLTGWNWKDVAAVAFNFRFAHPRIHRVASDHAAGMKLALEKLLALGHRRICVVLPTKQNAGTRGLWRDTYRSWTLDHEPESLLFECADQVKEEARFVTWWEAKRPDALLDACDNLLPALEARGFRCPQDFSYARLDWYPGFKRDCGGVNQNHDLLGQTAVELLSNCLRRHELGLPRNSQTILVEASWREGPTLVSRRLGNISASRLALGSGNRRV